VQDSFRNRIWHAIVLLLWGLWWGGLSFYAIVVVPVGTEQIGSVGQGFVTQKVTLFHNALCVAMGLVLAIEAYRFSNRFLWINCGFLTFITTLLFAGHVLLTSRMNFRDQTVPEGFYSQHALYLWLTAIEWLYGLALPLILLSTWQASEVRDSNSRSLSES